jgi:hypothetical protein
MNDEIIISLDSLTNVWLSLTDEDIKSPRLFNITIHSRLEKLLNNGKNCFFGKWMTMKMLLCLLADETGIRGTGRKYMRLIFLCFLRIGQYFLQQDVRNEDVIGNLLGFGFASDNRDNHFVLPANNSIATFKTINSERYRKFIILKDWNSFQWKRNSNVWEAIDNWCISTAKYFTIKNNLYYIYFETQATIPFANNGIFKQTLQAKWFILAQLLEMLLQIHAKGIVIMNLDESKLFIDNQRRIKLGYLDCALDLNNLPKIVSLRYSSNMPQELSNTDSICPDMYDLRLIDAYSVGMVLAKSVFSPEDIYNNVSSMQVNDPFLETVKLLISNNAELRKGWTFLANEYLKWFVRQNVTYEDLYYN